MPDSQEKTLVDEYNERCTRIVAHVCRHMLNGPFGSAFEALLAAADEFASDKDDANLAWLKLARRVSTEVRLDQVPIDLAQVANELGDMLVALYVDELDAVCSPPSLDAYRQSHSLSADMKTTQASSTASVVQTYFAVAIERSRHMARLQAGLIAGLGDFEEALDGSGMDIGSLARNFSAGAVAVMQPLIGIPALLANMKSESDQAKAADALVETYQRQLVELFNAGEALEDAVNRAIDKSEQYIVAKIRESVNEPIARLLSELERRELSTAHYRAYVSDELLEVEKLEREFFGD